MTENILGKIATIIVDISAGSLDKGFDYLIPDELAGQIIPGSAVKIPFGRGNREITGYVISIKNSSDFDAIRKYLHREDYWGLRDLYTIATAGV